MVLLLEILAIRVYFSGMTTKRHKRTDSAPVRVNREDRGELRTSHETQEGYMWVDAFIARPGVYEYLNPDGTVRRELVLPEELHKADSIGTLGGKPVTLEHPDEDVTVENIHKHGAGHVMPNITIVEDGRVKVEYLVTRKDAIQALKSKQKRENSPGYTVEIERNGGVHPEFGAYDVIQRNRIYNHAAIVERARGGSTIHSRVDAAVQVRTDEQQCDEDEMNLDELKKALKGAGVNADMASKVMDMLTKDMEAAEKKAEQAEEAKKDALEKLGALQAKWDGRHDWFDQRAAFVAKAKSFGVEAGRKDSAEIRKAIVLAAKPDARTDADDSYYAVAFDFLTPPNGNEGGAGNARQDSTPSFTVNVDAQPKPNGSRNDGLDWGEEQPV